MKTIHTRRTIRKYQNREVTNELLNQLLASAMRTQTMGSSTVSSSPARKR